MKKICIHWSAGTYRHGALEHEHYHYTCDNVGAIMAGKFKPEDNIPPLKAGKYAAHAGGGNSNTIGFAFLGMAGFKNANHVGDYPLTREQCESGFKFLADLASKHGIPVDDQHIYTHYLFGLRNPKTSSRGKIDIIHLPWAPHIKASEVNAFILGKIRWYQNRARGT